MNHFFILCTHLRTELLLLVIKIYHTTCNYVTHTFFTSLENHFESQGQFKGPLLEAKTGLGDHFWQPKLVWGDHFWQPKLVWGGTSFSQGGPVLAAKSGPPRPVLAAKTGPGD